MGRRGKERGDKKDKMVYSDNKVGREEKRKGTRGRGRRVMENDVDGY